MGRVLLLLASFELGSTVLHFAFVHYIFLTFFFKSTRATEAGIILCHIAHVYKPTAANGII